MPSSVKFQNCIKFVMWRRPTLHVAGDGTNWTSLGSRWCRVQVWEFRRPEVLQGLWLHNNPAEPMGGAGPRGKLNQMSRQQDVCQHSGKSSQHHNNTAGGGRGFSWAEDGVKQTSADGNVGWCSVLWPNQPRRRSKTTESCPASRGNSGFVDLSPPEEAAYHAFHKAERV